MTAITSSMESSKIPDHFMIANVEHLNRDLALLAEKKDIMRSL